MTSRPVADTNVCSGEGYDYQEQTGYDIYIEDKILLHASDRLSLSDDGVSFAVTDKSARDKMYYWSGSQLKSNTHFSCDPGVCRSPFLYGVDWLNSARYSSGVFSVSYCLGTSSSGSRKRRLSTYKSMRSFTRLAASGTKKQRRVPRGSTLARAERGHSTSSDGRVEFLDHLSPAYTGLSVNDVSVSSTGAGSIAAAVSPSSLRVYIRCHGTVSRRCREWRARSTLDVTALGMLGGFEWSLLRGHVA